MPGACDLVHELDGTHQLIAGALVDHRRRRLLAARARRQRNDEVRCARSLVFDAARRVMVAHEETPARLVVEAHGDANRVEVTFRADH